ASGSSPARSWPPPVSAPSTRASSRLSAPSSARSRSSSWSFSSCNAGPPACSPSGVAMRTRELLLVAAAGVILVLGLPLCNMLRPGSALYVSDFTLNLFGKFLAYAVLALGLDLLWGYAGVLSLGHGVFFGLGAYV